MGLFSKKEPYQYNVLEKYKIDIEKTNQVFLGSGDTKDSWRGREFCELVAENRDYQFYGYRTHSDRSGGYILRREKGKPRKVVFFGESKMFNCVFHDYLFQVDRGGELGRFGITGRNVNTGVQVQFNWLSERAKFIVINGYGRFYSQDSVKGVFVKDRKLIFKVSREQSSDPREKDVTPDKYDINLEYELVVEYVSGKFKATRVYHVVEESQLGMEEDIPNSSPEEGATSTPMAVDEPLKGTKPRTLGRDETKHISCAYEGREDDCPNECGRCTIAIKTDGDVALAQNLLQDAIRLYKKAVFIEPKFAEAWVNLGNAYGMKSEYNNALSAFDKALVIDPTYGKALLGKAITLRNVGELDEAMKIANIILETYNADEVVAFKKGLLEHGVNDNQYLIENQKLANILDNYAFHIMENNNLLNEDGKITLIKGLYYPESFTEQVLAYCRKKYASLGESKVKGECVITSFYGSICAAIFHHNNNDVYSNVSPFEYLREHIDVEFTDVNAEKLLHTKAGEEKAEYIWGIISPYVSFSLEAFRQVTVLTDELMLVAMKNAYEIGMLTAFYYLQGKDRKHSLGTDDEIDEALARLAKDKKDDTPPPPSAMCYSPRGGW